MPHKLVRTISHLKSYSTIWFLSPKNNRVWLLFFKDNYTCCTLSFYASLVIFQLGISAFISTTLSVVGNTKIKSRTKKWRLIFDCGIFIIFQHSTRKSLEPCVCTLWQIKRPETGLCACGTGRMTGEHILQEYIRSAEKAYVTTTSATSREAIWGCTSWPHI